MVACECKQSLHTWMEAGQEHVNEKSFSSSKMTASLVTGGCEPPSDTAKLNLLCVQYCERRTATFRVDSSEKVSSSVWSTLGDASPWGDGHPHVFPSVPWRRWRCGEISVWQIPQPWRMCDQVIYFQHRHIFISSCVRSLGLSHNGVCLNDRGDRKENDVLFIFSSQVAPHSIAQGKGAVYSTVCTPSDRQTVLVLDLLNLLARDSSCCDSSPPGDVQ